MRALAVLALAGCLAPDATGGDGGVAGDGGAGSVTVTITGPTAGAQIPRDYLYLDGRWVAKVTFTASTSTKVSAVEWLSGGNLRGVGSPPDYAFTDTFSVDGAKMLDAVVYGPHDQELGRASVALTITPPTAANADCATQLGVLGVAFTAGPPTMGIADPITMALPLKGMAFTPAGSTDARASLVMDCRFALALWRLVDVLAARHIVNVVDNGLYKYRCVSGSEQPPCPVSGLSPHAAGIALDVAGLVAADGTSLSVGSDWVIDTLAQGQTTCTVTPSGSLKNQLLHAIACDVWESGTFTVLLTPNYRSTMQFFYLDILNPMTFLQ
jgi:hypothetical protein